MVEILSDTQVAASEQPLYTLGILADTHIPDRTRVLHPTILGHFSALGVNTIFHAGDICSPGVITRLQEIAPVYAVRGNRDWLLRHSLPRVIQVELAGIQIGMAHGHGGFWHYLIDKYHYFIDGYRYQRYADYLNKALPGAEIILFGHTHTPETRLENGRLMYNPGSSCVKDGMGNGPSFGIIQIYSAKRLHIRTIPVPI